MARSTEVFCWGSLNPVPGEENPTPVEAGRRGLEAARVCAGSGRALLVGAKSATWLSGQDGSGEDPWDVPGIECAAFGQNHTLLLHKVAATTEGDCANDAGGSETKTEVLAWGSGGQGQLGIGTITLESELPKTIPALSAYRVVQVACGEQHSAAVTSYGDLFTWGRGTEGQLGHASRHLPPELNDAMTGVQLRPKPVPAFLATKKRQRPVAGVSCGSNFTLVVTRAGEAWAFGGGAMGQLGIGRVTSVGVPKVVMPSCPATGEPFVEVAAGWSHALARTSGGRILSWGFNALGALGLGDHRTRFLPEAVPLDGWQKQQQQQQPDDKGGGCGSNPLNNPPAAKTAKITAVKVHACGNCSGALSADGELFTWGCGSAGGLGHRGEGEGQYGRPERVEHVLRPRRVERLVGAQVTDFALSNKGGVALVPPRVASIEPASGPMESGCKVVIKGYGFWDSPDIVVKFTPVSKGHKPSASRSAVGTYMPRETGQGGVEFVTCTAPCFASPEAAYVEVSVDGTSFTSDCTRFQYYRTPELTQVTPDTCRPPLPRLRVDGEHLRPNENETLLVRFEEEQEEDSTEERGDGGGDEAAPLLGGTGNDTTRSALSRSIARRVFVVPGRVESEVIEVGTDPDTELPIHEERWFLACGSPPIPPGAKLPFVSRVTVAPNGADFDGESLRFIAHDPHADVCLPSAVPAPAPPLPASGAAAAAADEDDDGDKSSDGGEARGPCIHITGRNLYRGANVAVRLRFGQDDESIVPFHTVSFDASSESIVGVVPIDAGELVAGAPGAPPPKEAQQRPPGVSVVVEVSVDGVEFFAVPERLTLYRGPQLTLHGDGLYPAAEGGLAELKTTAPSFRGNQAKVRLVSDVHGIDVTLPLLSSPPAEEVEEGAGEASGVPGGEAGGATPAPGQPSPAAGENEGKPTPVQEPAKDAAVQGEEQQSGEVASTEASDDSVWEEREVPTSEESFFFAVPPLPKPTQGELASCGSTDGQGQDAAVAVATRAQGDQSVSSKAPHAPTSPKGAGAAADDQGGEAPASPEETNRALSVFVSLNGNDWQPVSGPPLTYFQPPPEPIPVPEDEPKKGKGKKK
ncbi:unnamed protein product [Ectocarpus sp. 8 AP-2014]